MNAKLTPILRGLLLALVLVGACAAPLHACRIVVPPHWPPRPFPPHPRPRPPALREMEVKSHRVQIDIRRHTATITVEAVFHNPNHRQIEGTYLFPIARGAAVSSFAMTMNGRTMEAELLPAGKARSIYESIVRSMKDPALLEYADEGLLRARVFPIGANADVAIRLTYEQIVRRDGTLCRVRYPLLSAKPGGTNALQTLEIVTRIDTGGGLRNVFAPGFKTELDQRKGGKATLTYKASNVVPDRDFEVLYSEDKRPVGVEFLGYRKNGKGYFMMLVAPDSELQAQEIGSKEITFVVDTSGSMMGDKIRQAREALFFCIKALGENDTFNIVRFSTDVDALAEVPMPASEANREKALEFVEGLRASGGTAIDDALVFALGQPPPKERVGMIVFLTDGLPTVGETDVAVILKHAAAAVGARRVFSFGVGFDVNTKLLGALADKTRGSSSYVRPKENLEIALSNFYSRVAHPVLTDLRIDSKGVRLSQLNPSRLPDLFKGAQITVTGRYEGTGRREMALSGVVGGTRETFRFPVDLDGNLRNAFVPRLWAVARVGYLQEQIALNGRTDELVDEIRRLGREYGILTEYTSFLIVEDGVKREELEKVRAEFRRVERGRANRMDSGKGAVDRSIRAKAMKQAAAPEAAGADSFGMSLRTSGEVRRVFDAAGLDEKRVRAMVRCLHDKTFYLRRADGVWYDSQIPAGQTPDIDVEVKAWSDEYFQLLRKHPLLRRYLLVGDNLVLCIDGKTIRIRP